MRTRLSTQERRDQLLVIGTELFATRPYEDVGIEEVAEVAGVSRGLLYHYFATKRDFFIAIVRTEAERILRITEPDPARSLDEQLTAGLNAYLDYVREHPDGYRVLNRAAYSVDKEIRRVCEANFAVQEQRVLRALSGAFVPTAATALAVRGWLHFVITVCLDWLDHPEVDRAEVRDLCARAFVAVVGLA